MSIVEDKVVLRST